MKYDKNQDLETYYDVTHTLNDNCGINFEKMYKKLFNFNFIKYI